ncbi:MAG TPA: CHAT domain-containing protein [Thermoanaerobaculia bacterium]|nr:CHAT domain-containing protein [Thermoanaerobaculia bacterium]
MHDHLDALAQRVIERLDAGSTGLLLDFGAEERQVLFQRFTGLAREALGGLGLTDEERPLALAWMAFEETERFLPAAALYALAADQLPLEGEPADRHERVLLRSRLGIVLRQLAADGDQEALARCAELGRGTVQLADRLWRLPGLPKDDFYALIYALQSWLGDLWRELGDFQAATRAYSEASIVGRTVDERVSAGVSMAESYERLGAPQRAYEMLMLAEDEARLVEDEVIREHWEAAVWQLRFTLGAPPKPPEERAGGSWRLELFDALEEGYRGALERDGSPSPAHLTSYLRFLENALAETPADDGDGRHPLLTQLAYVRMGMGEPGLAEEALRQAETLEPGIEDDGLIVDRELMTARIVLHTGDDPEKVLERLTGLISRAAQAGGERELQVLGLLLEAAAQCPLGVGVPELCGWVRRVLALFADSLAALPGAPARRRAREIHQRKLESALAALLSMANRPGIPEEEAQTLLAEAWGLIMVSRNPELESRPSKPAYDISLHLRPLEDAFHAALRGHVICHTVSRGAWIEALEAVHELERVHLRAPARLTTEPVAAPDGVGLAFFHFRDLSASQPWIVLGSYDGTIYAREIEFSPALLAPFQFRLGGAAPRDLKGPAPAGPEKTRPPLASVLPPGLGLLVIRRLPSFGSGEKSARLEPFSQVFWRIFPDGALHGVAFEMLAERQPGCVFGQDRAVGLCLRSRPPAACDRPVDFSRGWLGLGGVPSARPLPNSKREVETLQSYLQQMGHPAQCLIGPEAHADALRDLLLSSRPAVLHFATHGLADREHAEACALLLADCEQRPERELLPFRLIRQLDLRGVDLVVLSACTSLVGPSSRSAGMEGLAWAFLEAGAAQVVASRVPVADDATADLMCKLYHHLQELPVATALGRTRGEWLEDGRSPEHIDPWSVWT